MTKVDALALVLVGLIVANAYGQEPYAAKLDEIVVTAQKKEENLQSVPISVQVIDAESLEKASITGLGDLKTLVPSVQFLPYPTAQENLYIAMRGVFPAVMEISQDSPIAVHIDGVYIARGNGLNMAIADLERVEVLKGPQGTLYGRNATAGALNLITARPGDAFAFTQQLTYGNYDRRMTKTTVNVPFGQSLAVKLSYINDSRDGFIKDSNGGGRDFGDRNSQAARFDLRWQPTASVTVDYSYDWSEVRYLPNINQCLTQKASIGGNVANASGYPAALCSRKQLKSIPLPNNDHIYALPDSEVTNDGHTLNISWSVNDWLSVRSVTGYRSLDDQLYGLVTSSNDAVIGAFGIAFGSRTTYAPAVTRVRDDYFSQEFQLLGSVSESLSFTAGIYYFDEEGTVRTPTGALGVVPLGTLPLNMLNPALPAIDSPVNVVILQNRNHVDAENTSKAVYAQLTWVPDFLGQKLAITPGIRYTKDHRKVFQDKGGNSNFLNTIIGDLGGDPVGGYVGSGNNRFSKTTPSLTLQYYVNDEVMVYGKVVKGYKAGGFALGSSSGVTFSAGFGPEEVVSTELGFKGEFLDRRLRANFALFQSKYSDQQISVANPPPGSTANNIFDVLNAGKSTYKGAELELTAALTGSLRVGLDYSWIDFEFDKIRGPNGVNITRYFHMLAPKSSYAISLDYTFGRLGPGQLDFHLDYSYVGASYPQIRDVYDPSTGSLVVRTDPDFSKTPSYKLWNARLSLTDIDIGPGGQGRLQIGLWGKNLADEEYPVFVADPGVSGMVGSQSAWGEPRTYGVDLIYRY